MSSSPGATTLHWRSILLCISMVVVLLSLVARTSAPTSLPAALSTTPNRLPKYQPVGLRSRIPSPFRLRRRQSRKTTYEYAYAYFYPPYV